jgi:hypothetical protein
MVDLSACVDHVKQSDKRVYGEAESLLRAASLPWIPTHHAYLYGSKFRACIASVCLVKVLLFCRESALAYY